MKCDVYDTYVRLKNGRFLHFDIIVPQHTVYDSVLQFGRHYLQKIGMAAEQLEPTLCRFCHIEQALPEVESSIRQTGVYILPMEGCPTPQ